MKNPSAATLFVTLVRAGAVPGLDVSVGGNSDSLQLSERGYALLKQQFPGARPYVETLSSSKPQSAVEAVHRCLGVDFTERLLSRIAHRLDQLSEGQAAWYLQEMLGGVEERTGICIYSQLKLRLSWGDQARVCYLLQNSHIAEPCSAWISDLIMAAGGSESDYCVEDATIFVSEQGLRLLALVWVGEYDFYDQLAQCY